MRDVLLGLCAALAMACVFLWWRLDSTKEQLLVATTNVATMAKTNQEQTKSLNDLVKKHNLLIEEREAERQAGAKELGRVIAQRDLARQQAQERRRTDHEAIAQDPACTGWSDAPVCPAADRSLRDAARRHEDGDGRGEGAGEAGGSGAPASTDGGSGPA